MDREPEQRRDLEPAPPGPNKMGGELFQITDRYFSVIYGRRTEQVHILRNQPFAGTKR